MFNFLRRNKKVKPAKVKSYVEQERYFPSDYLFWGDCQVDVEEDGLKYSYCHRDCFLGNSENGGEDEFGISEAFVMRVLTGKYNGGFYAPEVKCGDVILTIPQQEGEDVVYVFAIEDFKLGKDARDSFKVSEIQEYINRVNAQNKQIAKNKAVAENAKTPQNI